nr:reverse transcriptase domain-containing protein [Tanacetum cinerariifolium]
MQTRSSSRLVSNPSSNPTLFTNSNPKDRNHRRSKPRIEEFNLDKLSPPIVTMADQRTMAQLLQAPTNGYEDAIVVPAITADNFELKHGLLTLVQNKLFFGHEKEDPHAHIRYFNKITSTMKFSNVPNTSIKLMLFPFSLEVAARIWLEKEPPLSIFTWDDLVSKFINQFFPPSKTTNLQLHQLDIFYNALNSKDQDSLNSATSGNFLDKMPRECLAIIESKSKVHYSRNKPVIAKVSTNTFTSGISPYVAELKDMVKALLLNKKSQNQSPATVKAVEESCVTCGGAHSYHNFPATNGNVYHDNIQEFVSQASAVNYNQGNTSYRPSTMSNQIRPPAYQALAPQTQGVSKEDFSAYVKANDAVMRNMQNQLTNLTELITKFVNSNSASTSSSGTLSSNTIANPRSDLKAITTGSGVSYDGPHIPPLTSFLPKVVENEPEVTKDTVHLTNNESTKDVQPQYVQSESSILNSETVTSPISEPVIALVNALILMPKFASTLKALTGNKEKLSEMARALLNEHCSAVLLKKLPKKLGDPSKFMIPCDFPIMAECLALADLGASINLMPWCVWKRLYILDLTPTCMTLELPDHSISRLVGVAEDVYVKVGSFHFPTDFVVVDFDADPRVPLILERSFLKIGRALIDVFDGNYMPEVHKELKNCEAKSDKSSIDEPSEFELKDLPPHLEYAFLEGDDKLPVIIAKDLSVEEKTALITVLKSTREPSLRNSLISRSYLSHLERVLKRCEDTNLCPNWEKSHFMVKEGIVLGHKISKQGIEVDKAKVDVITKLPHLTTIKAPILIAPDWDMPFELMCNASDFAIGAVLGKHQDKHFRPIHYASKTMTEAESNYTTTDKEMLAVVYAFEKFRSYLIMNKSIVYTDHSALKYLFAKKDSKAKLL